MTVTVEQFTDHLDTAAAGRLFNATLADVVDEHPNLPRIS